MNQTTNSDRRRSQRNGSSGYASSGGRRHSRSQKKILKLLLLSWGLGIGLVLAVFGIILSSAETSTVKSEFYQYQSSVREQLKKKEQQAQRLSELEAENQRLKNELQKMVQGRIPSLRPLEFDVTIPIKKDYLQHISFTLTGTQSNRHYEYRAVLKNNGKRGIQPDVTIFLFDRMGVQIGMARLSKDEATSEFTHDTLRAGERRAYASSIDLSRDTDPEYFLVEVK